MGVYSQILVSAGRSLRSQNKIFGFVATIISPGVCVTASRAVFPIISVKSETEFAQNVVLR